jgi:hypothetical protein
VRTPISRRAIRASSQKRKTVRRNRDHVRTEGDNPGFLLIDFACEFASLPSYSRLIYHGSSFSGHRGCSFARDTARFCSMHQLRLNTARPRGNPNSGIHLSDRFCHHKGFHAHAHNVVMVRSTATISKDTTKKSRRKSDRALYSLLLYHTIPRLRVQVPNKVQSQRPQRNELGPKDLSYPDVSEPVSLAFLVWFG